MIEQIQVKKSVSGSFESGDLIAGKSLTFYWKAGRLFIAFLVILNVINIIFEVHKYAYWVIGVVVFLLYIIWLLKRWQVKMATALFANAYLGIAAGLLLALFEIVWYHKWWYLLDLIRQPFILVALGLATGFIFYLIIQSLKTRKKSKEPKGGGIYGRKETNFNKFR